jgi:hypothetical protein
MMRNWRWLGGVCCASLVAGVATFWHSTAATAQPGVTCDTPTTVFCDSSVPLPPNWHGHVFKLSQNYPAAAAAEPQPWLSFDPTTQQQQYIQAVLQYFYQGNIRPDAELSFEPSLNSSRQWFNAPWQDFGANGREPIHGMTRERVSRPQELDPHQTHAWNNYAVGFYNAPGGVTIGRVWSNHGAPNPSLALMSNGTVAAKLIFTTAPVSEVPYLQGAPVWNAYVYANPNDPAPKANSPRAVLQLRLLQIDIAVKDSRLASTTGWAFGTFVYGGGPSGTLGSGWTNVAPVGLIWGNDPGFNGTGTLQQSRLNPSVHMPHVGYQGRLNGPIDNAISSCTSCHGTAEFPAGVMVPPNGVNPAPWFRNIASGSTFDPGRTSIDYSLQLTVGLTNFRAASALAHAPNFAVRQQILRSILQTDGTPPRDGGPMH